MRKTNNTLNMPLAVRRGVSLMAVHGSVIFTAAFLDTAVLLRFVTIG